MPRPRKTVIKDEEWARVQPEIRRLYLVEDKSLKDVMMILSAFRDFRPSKAQLEWKLKQWHMTKNMTSTEWKHVIRRVRKRHFEGKDSKIYLSGIPLRLATVEKARSRHCYETTIEKTMRVNTPPPPDYLSLIIRTPSPQMVTNICNMHNIPWLLAKDFFKVLGNQISLSIKESNSSFRLRTDEELLWAAGNKSALTSHTSRLQYTFQALSLIMPEHILESHVFRAEGLLLSSQCGSNNTEAFEVLSFLLSNNFLQDGSKDEAALIDSLLYMLQITHSWVTLAVQQSTRLTLSLQSTLNRLFMEAVRRSNLGLIRSLLRIGVDVNQSLPDLRRKHGLWRAPRAFEYAAIVNNSPLAQLLIKHGASTEIKDLKIMATAWKMRKRYNTTPEEFNTFLLSNFTFRQEQEEIACGLLQSIASTTTTACPISEEIIGFFRNILRTPSSISQLLITAIVARSKFVFDLLSESRSHINIPNSSGETPLKAAIWGNDIEVLERLLELGACIDIPPAKTWQSRPIATSLQHAAFYADLDMLHRILLHGANLNFCHSSSAVSCELIIEDPRHRSRRFSFVKQVFGKTALQAALIGGNTENALFLLKTGATLVGGELVTAILSRQNSLVDQLLARGASLDDIPTNLDNVSVLEAAILTENTDLVFRIIDANPQAVTVPSLWAAIFVAEATSNLTLCRRLVEEYAKELKHDDIGIGTTISAAATLGVLNIAELMFTLGLRPKLSLAAIYKHSGINSFNENQPSKMSENYLQWRCVTCAYLGSEFLDSKFIHPLMKVAMDIGRLDYVEMLLKYGYHAPLWCHDVRSVGLGQLLYEHGTNMSWRAFQGSINRNDFELTEWLLSLDIDLNGRELEDGGGDVRFSRSPVQVVAEKGDAILLERLVNLGADINLPPVTNYSGVTALQAASIKGYFGLVRRMLELGADPSVPGSELFGRTALEGAAEHGRLDVVQLLLNSGVETDGNERRQYVRAIAFASEEGHHTVATLLKSHRQWTEADQRILDEMGLLDHDQRPKAIARRQEGLYYDSNEESEEDPDQEHESSETGLQSYDESSEGFPEAADDEAEKESSGTHEAVRGEAPSERLPSSIMDEVRQSIERDYYGATEKPVDEIWAEAYEALSSEMPWLSWQG